MLKKILLAVAVAAPMFMAAPAGTFGVINPQEIVNVMPDYATAQNTIKTVSDKYQTQAKALQDEYDKKMQEYQDLTKAKATEAQLEAKGKEIQDIQTRFQNFQQTAQSDLQKQQETLMAPIEQKLNNAIQSVGAKGGYTAIFMEGALMYKGSNLEDVSAKVKAELGIK